MDNVDFLNGFRKVVWDYIESYGRDPDDSQEWSLLVGAMNDKVLIPNWFHKYHFTQFAGMDEDQINEDQWEAIIDHFNGFLPDWMSREMVETILDNSEEIEEILKEVE